MQRTVYRCTYRGCGEQHVSVQTMEAHVRKDHLLKDDPERLLEDGEEEFYYTEIEDDSLSKLPSSPQQLLFQQQQQQAVAAGQYLPIRARSYSSSSASSSVSHLASLSLVDHLDMARPAHEDPGRGAIAAHRSILVQKPSSLIAMRRPDNAVSMPITIAPSAVSFSGKSARIRRILTSDLFLQHGSPGKYILISPPHRNDGGASIPSPVAAFPSSAPSGGSLNAAGNLMKSPTRRVREGKKCRKVYGLEQRDLWCTQCKWKKACARFGSGNNNNNQVVSSPPLLSTSSPAGSLLMTTMPTNRNVIVGSGASRAIKF